VVKTCKGSSDFLVSAAKKGVAAPAVPLSMHVAVGPMSWLSLSLKVKCMHARARQKATTSKDLTTAHACTRPK